MGSFESFGFEILFDVEYRNNFNTGAKKIFVQKEVPVNLCLADKYKVEFTSNRVDKTW